VGHQRRGRSGLHPGQPQDQRRAGNARAGV